MFALTPFKGRRFSPAIQDMDDFFNRLLWAPDMAGLHSFSDFDLYEKDGKLHLSIDVPGVKPEDLEITITKSTLSIRSKNESNEEKKDEGKTWYNKKSVSEFNYEVSLPFEIDTDKAEAACDNGKITVVAPRLQVSESKVLPLKKA